MRAVVFLAEVGFFAVVFLVVVGFFAVSFFAVIAVLLTLALPKPSEHARDEKLFHSIVEGFRSAMVFGRAPDWQLTAISAAKIVGVFVIAFVMFKRMDKYFADVI